MFLGDFLDAIGKFLSNLVVTAGQVTFEVTTSNGLAIFGINPQLPNLIMTFDG